MKSVARITDPATFARSNRSLFDTFISLSIKLDELTSGDEFNGFEKFEVLHNESPMMHPELGMPILVECVLTPSEFNTETGFGRVIAKALLYATESRALSTHCSEFPIEGPPKHVVDQLATVIVKHLRTKACIVDKVPA